MGRWAVCILGWLAAASAQQVIPADEFEMAGAVYTPPVQASLRVETRLVEVGVVVRDGAGRAVGGLTRDDFEIEDSGRKREIAAFSVENRAAPRQVEGQPPLPAASVPNGAATRPRPRLLALVFDDFSMAPSELMPTRAAAKRFVAEGLGGNGVASVFFVSQGQVLPFTSDPAKLDEALNHLMLRGRDAGMSTCPYINAYEAFQIAEHLDPSVLAAKVQEAISCGLCRPRDPSCPGKVESMAGPVWEQTRDTSRRTLYFLDDIVKYLSQLPGERVMVLASSGFISRTLEREREELVDRALRANVVIHSLDAKGLFTQDLGIAGPSMSLASQLLRQKLGTRPQMENNDSLAVLAESTGGLFFHNNNDLALGFHQLGLAPEVSYSLGFSPQGAADNRYHKLKVRLTSKGHYSVQARQGYFSQPAPPDPARAERPIDREVLAQDNPEEVPAQLILAAQGTTANHEPAVRAVLHLDTRRLPFAVTGRLRTLQLEIVLALFDERSAFVSGQAARATFLLHDDTFQRLSDGQNIGLTLPVPPGKYRLRCVIREENGGKFTAMDRAVEIRSSPHPLP
jgi:VWFA-related protein